MNAKIREHYQTIVLILLATLVFLIGGIKLLEYAFPQTAGVSNEIISSIIGDVLDEKLKPIIDDINNLNNYNIEQTTGRAISAYSKVFTIEDLNSSPEKRFSIMQGLKMDSCKELLLIIDRDRTLLFYDYLIGK